MNGPRRGLYGDAIGVMTEEFGPGRLLASGVSMPAGPEFTATIAKQEW